MGILGCGNIVRIAHAPAYAKYGVNVVGAYDPDPEAVAATRAIVPFPVVYESACALLADPRITVVDIAAHPAVRVPLVRQALAAGKHVLSQKPFADDILLAKAMVDAADLHGRRLAVNQNGRWAPAWRVATSLIAGGAIGEVTAITHQFEKSTWWAPGSVFDALPHCAIYDYAIHWIDITRTWLGDRPPHKVRARDYRTPNQPADSRTPWGFWVELVFEGGINALIRSTGVVHAEHQGHSFRIDGGAGLIRGSVLGNDHVELVRDGRVTRFPLDGKWFPDGFAGTMGELLSAIAEGREPSNSGRENLGTIELTLAACRSADEDGAAIAVGG